MSNARIGAHSYGGKRRRGGLIPLIIAPIAALLIAVLVARLFFNTFDSNDKAGIDLRNDAATAIGAETTNQAGALSAGAALVGGGGVPATTSSVGSSAIKGTVLFSEASATLDASSTQVIAQAVTILKADNATAVTVTGYTDVVGGTPVNDPLSQERADAVAAHLRSALGSSVTVNTAAKGESDPVAANSNSDGSDNPSGRQQNRRAVIAEG